MKKIASIDKLYMSEALKEAHTAAAEDEVPVGCVIVHNRRIIARSHNQVERLKDPTAHAEMLALTSATHYLKNKWLTEAVMYVTVEPCAMCAGALVLSRIKRLVFGARDPKTGAAGSVYNIVDGKKLNHHIKVTGGLLQEDCGLLLKGFFKRKR